MTRTFSPGARLRIAEAQYRTHADQCRNRPPCEPPSTDRRQARCRYGKQLEDAATTAWRDMVDSLSGAR